MITFEVKPNFTYLAHQVRSGIHALSPIRKIQSVWQSFLNYFSNLWTRLTTKPQKSIPAEIPKPKIVPIRIKSPKVKTPKKNVFKPALQSIKETDESLSPAKSAKARENWKKAIHLVKSQIRETSAAEMEALADKALKTTIVLGCIATAGMVALLWSQYSEKIDLSIDLPEVNPSLPLALESAKNHTASLYSLLERSVCRTYKYEIAKAVAVGSYNYVLYPAVKIGYLFTSAVVQTSAHLAQSAFHAMTAQPQQPPIVEAPKIPTPSITEINKGSFLRKPVQSIIAALQTMAPVSEPINDLQRGIPGSTTISV